MTQNPAPGWYPVEQGMERYWDGQAWTAQVRPTWSGHNVPPPVGVQPLPSASGMAMSPYGPAGAVAVSPKNPALAVIASFFLPGLGQLINGDTNKGVAMLVTYVVSFLLMLVLIGFVTAFGVWVWSMVDAYQGARDWNLRHGILS